MHLFAIRCIYSVHWFSLRCRPQLIRNSEFEPKRNNTPKHAYQSETESASWKTVYSSSCLILFWPIQRTGHPKQFIFFYINNHLLDQSRPKHSFIKISNQNHWPQQYVAQPIGCCRVHRLYGHCWSDRRVARLAHECFSVFLFRTRLSFG